jgi:hypothetical protein
LFKENDIMGSLFMQFGKKKWALRFFSPVVVIRPGAGTGKTICKKTAGAVVSAFLREQPTRAAACSSSLS